METRKWHDSRKLRLISAIALVGTIFVPLAYIDGAQWIDLVKGLVWAYVAGNVGEHGVNALAARPVAPAPATINPTQGGVP